MPTPLIVDNQETLLHEEIVRSISVNSMVKICINYFSYNALYNLIDSFGACQSIEITATSCRKRGAIAGGSWYVCKVTTRPLTGYYLSKH